MKPVYQCEICALTYDTENGALACEASHPKIEKVEQHGQTLGYPTMIVVYFSDGNIKRYYDSILGV